MKTLVKKNNTMTFLVTVFLLATVGLSAQNYEDDVYYSPSKDATKKKVKKQVANREANRTYRTKRKVENFSAAQRRYAKMLREKESRNNTTATVYKDKNSWVYNTQGLTQKKDINKKMSLYNRGNVDADNPNDSYYERNEYALWRPSRTTYVRTHPNWHSSFYFGFNSGWGDFYYRPYYTHRYNSYYWDWDYPYYGHYHAPRYYGMWDSPYYWRNHYYGPIGWGGYYHPYYSGYYHPYHDYYDGYYYNRRHYRNNYSYEQRPQEYRDSRVSMKRQYVPSRTEYRSDSNYSTARSTYRTTRYSNELNQRYRRGNEREINSRATRYRDIRNAPSSRTSSNPREFIRTRRIIKDPEADYRRRTTLTPTRSSPQEYRRTNNSESRMRRSTPSPSYRTRVPSRSNDRSSYRAPERRTTPTRSSPSRTTPSRSNDPQRYRR